MRTTRTASVLAAAIALSLGLAACGSGPEQPDQTGQALSTQPSYNPQPYENLKDGGTLTYSLRADLPPQLNRFQGDGTTDTSTVWEWYNPVLTTYSPTGEFQPNPDYLLDAKGENVGPNTKVTYTINPKATFNDGTPIDWKAFEATWKTNNGKDEAFIPNSTDGYDRITSVTRGSDDKQAVVTFAGYNVWWQSLFNFVLHPKAATPEVFNKGYIDKPHPEWGAGPYTVGKFDKQNATVTFVRNPKWWGKPGKLDSVTVAAMESTAAINAFRNNQLDATEVRDKDGMAQARQVPDVDIRTSGTPATYLFTLNSTAPALQDPVIRKAVFQAVDRKQLSDVIFQGLGYSEEPPGSSILSSFQTGYQDNVAKVVPYDPEQAKKDLDAAGWAVGPDGFRQKAGKTLEFTFVQTGQTPTKRATSSATVAMMKNIGVKLNVRETPSSEFSTLIAKKQFDMVLFGFKQSDPYSIAYLCQSYCTGSSLNKSGTGSEELNAELRKVNTLPTRDEQYAGANAAEVKALSTYGLLPVYSGPTIWATKKGLANFGSSLFLRPLPETVGYQK